ncbi:MAG: diguanylate cyclase, partial [Okeania sp. SIO2H7]|nr:diguanylate cyclase [Okeania sp. SIO2H7]
SQQWWQMVKLQQPISVILADVDFFKFYNDTYGHQAGDECLRQVARAIQEAVGGGNYLVARYGGEEFCAILPNTDVADSLAIAEKIQSRVRALNLPHAASKVSDCVTLSIGLATTIPNADTSVELQIALADKALYKAKTNGRDRVILS